MNSAHPIARPVCDECSREIAGTVRKIGMLTYCRACHDQAQQDRAHLSAEDAATLRAEVRDLRAEVARLRAALDNATRSGALLSQEVVRINQINREWVSK